ncbi:hypothetical protein [Nocardia sp. NPDC049149]|uniref:hypothetical protein n=1 Tax=Nocardia sp. NPDC049149 TaxID=3364315 RepID=UPI0037206CD5
MDEIEYVFGTGDGTVHVWTSEADLNLTGSGAPDAVRLDFDGDGLVDDALWDTSGVGLADVAALDLDDDNVLDHFYTDPSGNGTWNHHITGTSADAFSEPLNWIVRADHAAATEHAPQPEALAPEPDRLLDQPGGADDQLPDLADPASASDPSPGKHTDLPEYLLAHWMNRAGRDIDDRPITA